MARLVLIFFLLTAVCLQGSYSLIDAIEKEIDRGPKFVIESPSSLVFSNSSGTVINCTAIGSPSPRVWWIQRDHLRSSFSHESGDVSFSSGDLSHLHPHHPSSSTSFSSSTLGSSNSFRHIRSDGSLLFTPFEMRDQRSFRADVHNTAYLCVASNSQGNMMSRQVNVKTGE